MNIKPATLALVVLLSSAPAAVAATSHTASNPDSCISLNQGDWNACNVGNGGAGNRHYRPVVKTPSTPDSCISLNQGDWNACNVGNSGAGNRPYRAPSR